MLLPLSVNLCCLDFNHEMSQNYALLPVFQNYSAVLYSSWQNVLLSISMDLCCFDSDHDNWICSPIQELKELLNETPWLRVIRYFLDGKVNRFSPRDIFCLRDSSKSFSIHTTPLFWVLSTSSFVCWRHICFL